jgi:hypothetical protein
MSSVRSNKRSRARRPATVHKPKGSFHARVQQVGADPTQDSLPAVGQTLLDGLRPAGFLRKGSEG